MDPVDAYFQQHLWITLDQDDREQSDVLVATLALGLLSALEMSVVSLEMAEKALFNVGTLNHFEPRA